MPKFLFFFLSLVFSLASPAISLDAIARNCVFRFLENSVLRDYGAYISSLDESVSKKVRLVTPWLPKPLKGSTPIYADVGTGTGSLADGLAGLYAGARVIGVDASEMMVKHARSTYSKPNLEFRLATAGNRFAKNADAAVYGSILHEIFSFSGDNLPMVAKTLGVASESLRPGGRVIIRDFVMPENPNRRVTLRLRRAGEVPGKTFADFAEAWGARGRKVMANRLSRNEAFDEYETTLGSAMEFLFRYKDGQWNPELAERYFFWSESQARETLGGAGFIVIHAEKESNRGKVRKIEREQGMIFDPGTGRKLRLPEDKMLIVGEKATISPPRRVPALSLPSESQ